jgi:hypothetical protein
MLIYGEDPFDYLKLMEKEYIENGESALYKTYIIAYNYTEKQKVEYVDNEREILYETELGKIEIPDPYLSFLYLSR